MNRKSIRFRITVIASAAVAATLVMAGIALVLLQRNALRAGLDETLAQRADDLGLLIQAGPLLPDGFSGDSTEGFAMLIGLDGELLVATPNLVGNPAPLWAQQSAGPGDRVRTLRGLDIDDDVFRVLSRDLNGVGIFHVGASYDVIAESSTALLAALAITIPGLVLVLAAVVWWLVGRTLRPVEDIRSEVAKIGSSDLQRRILQPGTEDEIDRLAGTMNEMLARLEVSIGRQQRFVADASHELRSPLTRMRSEIEVSLAESRNPEQQAILESLIEEVVGLQHLVEDLLHLARADALGSEAVFVRLDLDDLVIREARRIQARQRVAIDLSGVSGAQIMGDAGHLTRGLRNLLDNAERHGAARITVDLTETDNMAVLVVTDDGPGIPAEQAELVFERFGRLDAARGASTGGTGLGLAITREIVEGHGGSITLIAAGSPGATFELRLPLAP